MFGEWVRYQRDQLHLTREQLADLVGCSIAMLRKIEDGERRPSTQIAGLLANCLNIPSEERSTFVKVARGELSVDHLHALSTPDISTRKSRINFPVLSTPLIGRQLETEELCNLLRDPQVRLLTLTGLGGIGKTYLAIDAASKVKDAFPDGVYFVPFAPVINHRFIVPVIADAIGFAFQNQSRVDPKNQLFSYLKEKQILLLLDNLEQLLSEPGIEILADLLEIIPQVKILTTSRERLHLQDEWVFEVHGLPVPDRSSLEESLKNTSVELFLLAAKQANVRFDAASEDFSAVIRICQLLNGMPLGIKLAATWSRMLSCSEIAQEIERGLGFLRTSMRDFPARHRSIQAVFDYSWKQLSHEEQEALLHLCVFQGGFTRQSAEQLASTEVAILFSLMEKSLIQRNLSGRYDLHELIRQFVTERLAEDPEKQAKVQEKHGRYYLNFYACRCERLQSSTQNKTLIELVEEKENFKSAWNWAVDHSEFSLLEPTLRTFIMLFDMRGWLHEAADMLDSALNALASVTPPFSLDRANQVALGHLLANRGLFAFRLGDFEQAQSMLQQSLEVIHPINEPRVLVVSQTFLAMVMESTGNYARALELYLEGMEVASAIGDRWFAALCSLGGTALSGFILKTTKPEDTFVRFHTVVSEWRTISDPRLTAIALNNLSLSAQILGRYDEASAALEESIALLINSGDRWGLGFAYRGLGLIAQTRGQHPEAVESFQKSLDTLTGLGDRQDTARVLAEMSRSLIALGDEAGARDSWRKSLNLAIETKGTFIALEVLAGFAGLLAVRDDPEYAFELLLFVLDHPASIHDTKERANKIILDVQAQLTHQQIEAARKRVNAISLEAVIDETLEKI